MMRWIADHAATLGAVGGASFTATFIYAGKRLVDYLLPRGHHFRIADRYSTPNDHPDEEDTHDKPAQ